MSNKIIIALGLFVIVVMCLFLSATYWSRQENLRNENLISDSVDYQAQLKEIESMYQETHNRQNNVIEGLCSYINASFETDKVVQADIDRDGVKEPIAYPQLCNQYVELPGDQCVVENSDGTAGTVEGDCAEADL